MIPRRCRRSGVRSWAPTRLERARRFAAMLQSLQVPVQETEFPGLGHEIGDAERDEALAWVRSRR